MVNNLIYDPRRNQKKAIAMPYDPNKNPAKVTQYGGQPTVANAAPATAGTTTTPPKPKDVFNPPSGQTSLRQYLQASGYDDKDITYDNGQVFVQGKLYGQYTPGEDGRIYDTRANLERSLATFQGQGRNAQLNSLLGRMTDKLDQPFQYQEFEYNRDTDPAFQAIQAKYQQDANRASNNAMVSMGQRGIGNSSATGDRVAQIQSQAAVDLNAKLTPELMAQAYQRFADGRNLAYQSYRDNIGDTRDTATLLNGLLQQGFQNEVTEAGLTGRYRGENTMDRRRFNVDTALAVGDRAGMILEPKDSPAEVVRQVTSGTAPRTLEGQKYQDGRNDLEYEKAYRSQRDSEEDRRWWAEYNRGGEELAHQRGIDWARLSEQQKARLSDDAYRNKNLSLQREEFEYKKEQDKNELPKGSTAEEYAKYIDGAVIYDDDPSGKRVITNQGSIEDMILESELSTEEKKKLYRRYGIPWNPEGN